MEKRYSGWLFLIGVAGLVIAADQISKGVVVARLSINHAIPVIDGFFNIVHVQNPGGAFGFLADQDSRVRPFLFMIGSVAAVGMLIYLFTRMHPGTRLFSLGIALILGGAFGNMIDRLRLGSVIDFLDFYIGNLHWPAFNVADSSVSVGCGILILQMLMNPKAGNTHIRSSH
ncbi:MAG: signal peptidase II [Thermodesulfobacteriota bacterium]